ncbi:MAG: Ig-like domain-containing protein [Vicinamibacterales bacterium]
MTYRIVRHGIVAIAIAAFATACSKSPTGPSGSNGGGNTASVTSVTVSGTLSVTEGSTSQLKATASMSNGQTQDVTGQATWRSADTTIATVSGTGLVTTLKPGTTDITAAYQSQTGRGTLQVKTATYRVSVTAQSITVLGTCDDFTQGLTVGEFAIRVLAIAPGGVQRTLSQTREYPGNPDNLYDFQLGEGASATLNDSTTFTLPGESGQFVRVQFNATEWDNQIVIIPPSTRKVHDDNMDDRSTSRTHSFTGSTFSSLGPNTLSLGNSSCGIRLNYSVSASQQ